jgi:hypothetical protein
MPAKVLEAKFVEKEVIYTLLKDDNFYIIEGVPARVNTETGEQLFAPETVERLQQIVWEKEDPVRQIPAQVYRFAA